MMVVVFFIIIISAVPKCVAHVVAILNGFCWCTWIQEL